MHILRQPRRFDVCVIGSGPAGGFVTKELTEAGAHVLLLEAGEEVTPDRFAGHRWPYEYPRRGTGAERQGHFYPDDIGRHIRFAGADRVSVDRIRVLGGRGVHWNAVCLRFSEDDFREGSTGGIEPDWPITYHDLAPFYSLVEQTMGVCGTREGLAALPDGDYYAPPPNMRCAETIARRAGRRLGIPVIPVRKALLLGQPKGRRLPCHFCRHCMDGCAVGAIANSVNTLIPLAEATGRLTVRANALVREVEVDREGRATGVSFIDRTDRRTHHARADIIVVSCGAIESARLLLNSTSARFPNGLGNSSDLVGRHLTGHTLLSMFGYVTELAGREDVNRDGATDHATVPRFTHLRKDRGYVGGFGAQLQYESPEYPHHARSVPGFGSSYKQRVRELHPAMLQLGAFGKVLARADNRVTVDRDRLDAHGIPIPVVTFSYSENDRAIWRDMSATFEELYHAAGTELLINNDQRLSGFASHEVGTCRMGRDPKTSVLDPYCRSHEVPNLFVVDGSPFVTFPEKNPTLTIMALAARTGRYIAEARRRGDV